MIKADYIIYPSNDIRVLSSASRILSSNLMNNSNLDIYFNPMNYLNFFEIIKELRKMKEILKKSDVSERILKSEAAWSRFAYLRIANITFKENILKHLKNDLVLFNSSAGEVDLESISFLLKNNIRVVVGGSTLTIIPLLKFRSILKTYGCTETHLKNIILVKGYVTKKTDLHEIIKNWKDVELEDFHVADFFECTESYFATHHDIIKTLCKHNNVEYIKDRDHWSNFGGACLFLRSGCWYKKCSFCSYSKYDNRMNINSSDKSPEYIAHKIIEMLDIHHIKNIFITDDYFVFNNKNRIILKILKNNGISASTFTGIKLLATDKYAKNMAEYFDGIKIGMESVNDFTLKKITKGYTKKEILKAVENIKKYFHKKTHISVNIIMNLISLGEDKVLEDYAFLKDLKMDMIENGFKYFFYNYSNLNISHTSKDKIIDGKLIRENNEERSTTGNYYIREIMKKGNIYIPRENWGVLKQDYKRFDINGNELKSDIDIIPLEDISFLFARC